MWGEGGEGGEFLLVLPTPSHPSHTPPSLLEPPFLSFLRGVGSGVEKRSGICWVSSQNCSLSDCSLGTRRALSGGQATLPANALIFYFGESIVEKTGFLTLTPNRLITDFFNLPNANS
ncbi:MAG: hypothetical protein F6J93_16880 [Oscillatoria sp. SIO1A7]|nr:hypothetical protein [Oscillatoria sp. SIO1A7]